MSLHRSHGRSAGADRPAHARFALAVAALGLFGAALAHAYLDASTPAAFEVSAAVTVVELRFTSDLEPSFSHFALRRLELPDDAWPSNPAAPSDADRMRMNALAARSMTDTADAALVPIEVAPTRRTPVVTLTPAAALEPGAYAVAYEVLSVDGHTVSGHVVFFVLAD